MVNSNFPTVKKTRSISIASSSRWTTPPRFDRLGAGVIT